MARRELRGGGTDTRISTPFTQHPINLKRQSITANAETVDTSVKPTCTQDLQPPAVLPARGLSVHLFHIVKCPTVDLHALLAAVEIVVGDKNMGF